MAKKVLKFGGTSVGTIDRILHVAKIIKKEFDAGNKIIAMLFQQCLVKQMNY